MTSRAGGKGQPWPFWSSAICGRHERDLWPEPSPERVARMVEALGWLSFVSEIDARILLGRSWIAPTGTRPILSPLTLARGLGLGRTEIEQRHGYALRVIAGLLSEAERAQAAD